MNNFKLKTAKMMLAGILVFIIIFNIITTKSYSATLDITTESNRIEGDFKFNYNLGFQDTMITSDFVLEFDSNYIEFLGTDTDNVEYNQIENGKIIFLYVDENGKGTSNININFKIKGFYDDFSTQIRITDINAYSLTKGENYSSKDYDLTKTVMTISSKGKEEAKSDENNQDTSDNKDDFNTNTPSEDNSNIGDIKDYNSNTININIDNVGSITNNNADNNNNDNSNTANSNSTIEISTPSEEQKPIGALPFAGNSISIVAIVLLIILIAHSGVSFIKYHKKETNIFMLFIVALILYGSIDSNAAGNIFIKNFDRIKNFEHLIVVMPDLENRNIKYSEFISVQKNNNVNIVQIRNKKGEIVEVDDYISTGDIAQSNEKIAYKIVVYGDVNSDGNVNSNDIAEILVHKLNNAELDALSKKSANLCNEDERIDSEDINIIKQYVLRTIKGNLVQKLPEELAKGIKIVAEKSEMNVGEEQSLSFIVDPEEMIIDDIEWSSSNENIATISEDGILTAKSNGIAYITAISKSDLKLNDTITIEVITPVIGVKLTHKKIEIEVGETRVISAIVQPVEAKHREVLWSTSNSKIASVDENGKITGIEEGKVTITATTKEGKFTDTCEVNVIEEEIISPPKDIYVREVVINKTYVTLTSGKKEKLEAFVLPATALDQSVYWETSDSNIVTVNQNGEIEAKSSGIATITAVSNDGGYTTSCVVVVDKVDVTSISLNETKINITKGESANLIATVLPSNATNKEVIWESSNELVATVEDGRIATIGSGIATISAKTKDGGYVAICTIQVAPINPSGIELDKREINIDVGRTTKINATVTPENADNKNVVWESSNENICVVDNFGNVTAIRKGNATITAKTEVGHKSATCRVQVNEEVVQPIAVSGVSLNKGTLTLNEGANETLVSTVSPENADNKNVIWESSNTSVAEVDENGKVTAKTAGTTTITVRTEDGNKTATCIVTVNRVAIHVTGVTLNKTSLELDKGADETLVATVAPENADNKNVIWESSNTDIAVVNENGKITAKKAGTTSITVRTEEGNKTATCTVIVKPRLATGIRLNKYETELEIGDSETLVATVEPEEADNKTVMWESSDSNIVNVSNGRITAKSAGTATIFARTADGEFSAECVVKVAERKISPESISLDKYQESLDMSSVKEQQLTATIYPENCNIDTNLTWTSSDEDIVRVEQNGKIIGISNGEATITVKTENNKTATCRVVVETSPVEINLNKSVVNLSLYENNTEQLDVNIEPRTANVKNGLTYSSENENIATVDRNGLITAHNEGTTRINVTTENGKSTSCTVNVSDDIRVELNTYNVELEVGKKTDVEVIIYPEDIKGSFECGYRNNNSIVLNVNKKNEFGKYEIEGLKVGETTIDFTVKINDKEFNLICNVKVKPSSTEPPEETIVSLSKNDIELNVGEQGFTNILVTPAQGFAFRLSYSGDSIEAATEPNSGKINITGKKSGTTIIVITVTVDEKEYVLNCNVRVKANGEQAPEETRVALSSNNMTLKVGEKKYLEIFVTPEQEYQATIMHSNIIDSEDAGGKFKLTGKKEGTYNVEVEVTAEDGSVHTLYCTIIVISNETSMGNILLENDENILNEKKTKFLPKSILKLFKEL